MLKSTVLQVNNHRVNFSVRCSHVSFAAYVETEAEWLFALIFYYT